MTDTADRLDERNALVGELAEILAVRAEPIVLLDRIVDWHRDRLARLRADIASDIEQLCDWTSNIRGIQRRYTHGEWHFGNGDDQTGICPYVAMAEVIRGNPDPRRQINIEHPDWCMVHPHCSLPAGHTEPCDLTA